MIWGTKRHQKHARVVCGCYVNYEEADVDRLVAILKKKQVTAAPAAAAAERVEYSKQPASVRAA